LLFKQIFATKKYEIYSIITIAFLSFFTGLSWTVSQLISDIFTPIAILTTAIILLGNYTGYKKILLYVLFFLAVATHMSHIMLFNIILICMLLLAKLIVPINYFPKRNYKIITLIILTNAAIVLMGSALDKSKHVFFMGAMVEHGILKHYLDDNCANKNYKLCAYKDSLPNKAYIFIWDEKSPFYKIGGWKENKEEFNEIIYSTFSQPKYIGLHIKASLNATFEQLCTFDIGDGNGSFLSGTQLFERIEKYFASDVKTYSNSLQSRREFSFLKSWNLLFTIIIILTTILMVIFALAMRKVFDYKLKFLSLFFLLSIILNAWDCATFANAIGRLGCKIIWVIPLLSILVIFKIWDERKNIKTEIYSTINFADCERSSDSIKTK